ncbi:hypothetical protein GCM10020000_87450 [Streptomyces olivoverticillatus]
MGRAGWVALSGTLVSQYGLWEFGRDTAHLPLLIRIGFVIMFDLLELQLFSLLYRNANPDEGWTRSLRLTHGTAWGAGGRFLHRQLLACAEPCVSAVHGDDAADDRLGHRARAPQADGRRGEEHA